MICTCKRLTFKNMVYMEYYHNAVIVKIFTECYRNVLRGGYFILGQHFQKSWVKRCVLRIFKYARLSVVVRRWAIIKKAVKHWGQTEARRAAPYYKHHLTDHPYRGHILPSQRILPRFISMFCWYI